MTDVSPSFLVFPPPPVDPQTQAQVLHEQARKARTRGEDREAQQLLAQAAVLSADDARIWAELAAVRLSLRQAPAALDAARRAIRLDPDLPAGWRACGLALVRSQQMAEAQAAIAKALELAPADPENQAALAVIHMLQGRLDEADALFRKARAAAPNLADAAANHAQVLMRLGQLESALTAARWACELRPAQGGPRHVLGTLLRRSGRMDEAGAALREALERDPQLMPAWLDLADLLRTTGKPAESETICRQGLALTPTLIPLRVNLGAALQEQGRLEDAEREYRAVLAQDSSIAIVHSNLAKLAEDRGDWTAAAASYRQAVALQPDNSDFRTYLEKAQWMASRAVVDPVQITLDAATYPDDPERQCRLAALYRSQGRQQEALTLVLRMIEQHPLAFAPNFTLASILLANRQSEDAAVMLRRALTLRPDAVEAAQQLAGILFHADQWSEAESAARIAVTLNPRYSDALITLATILQRTGRPDEAEAWAWKAVRDQPQNGELRAALGNIFQAQGRSAAAEELYRAAITLTPDLPLAHTNLGNLLRARGKPLEALLAHRQALTLRPDYPEAMSNLGHALLAAPQGLAEAETLLRRAVALKPDMLEGQNNLGLIVQYQGQVHEAESIYRRILSQTPNSSSALNNLGTSLSNQCRFAEAVDVFRYALAVDPDNPIANSNMLFALNYLWPLDRETVFREHQAWNERFGHPATCLPAPLDRDRNPERRLRIGYVSADLGRHPVGHFLAPLIVYHDPAQVEVTLYSGRILEDNITAFLKGKAHHWQRALGRGDDELAALIRADGIDILVDLGGHTNGNRLPVFARRPAPIQVTWLGYPNTTGLDAIDYRITDAIADPENDAEPFHSETLVRLPQGFHCYAPFADWVEPSEPPFLRQGHITFGSFNNLIKLSPACIAVWSKILRALPGSRMVIKSHQLLDASNRGYILGLFEAHGINPERLDLHAWVNNPQTHMRMFADLDIALDPFPYNGTTTTCEALWAGLPVVTLRGDRHVARVGASLLTTVGLPEMIAETPESYQEIALALATDPQRLITLRRTVREQMRLSPLTNGAGFSRHLEAAFRQMWRQWCANPAGVEQGRGLLS